VIAALDREGATEGSVCLGCRRRQREGVDGVRAASRLLGDPSKDGEAVEAPQLLLAAQPRVEHLERKSRGKAQHDARKDSAGDAQDGPRSNRCGRRSCFREDLKRRIRLILQRLQFDDSRFELVGARAARGVSEAVLEFRKDGVDVVVKLFGLLHDRLLREGVRKGGCFVRRRRLCPDDDDVGLRDRLGLDHAEEAFGRDLRIEIFLHPHRHVVVGDQASRRLDVAGGIGRWADDRQVHARALLLGSSRDHPHLRGAFVHLVRGRDVDQGHRRRDDRRRDDDPKALAKRRDIALEALLLCRGLDPVVGCRRPDPASVRRVHQWSILS
jgi:hypothetical protein